MTEPKPQYAVKSHFEGKVPVVRKIYDQLLKTLKRLGPIMEEPKKTSIHLVNSTALAGVATRSSYLILTLKSDHPLKNPRVFKSEQASAKRFHHEVKVSSPAEVDAELVGWLTEAYHLSA